MRECAGVLVCECVGVCVILVGKQRGLEGGPGLGIGAWEEVGT